MDDVVDDLEQADIAELMGEQEAQENSPLRASEGNSPRSQGKSND